MQTIANSLTWKSSSLTLVSKNISASFSNLGWIMILKSAVWEDDFIDDGEQILDEHLKNMKLTVKLSYYDIQ